VETTYAVEKIPRRTWTILTVVSICSVLNPLSQSILNLAFPSLQQAFSESSAATLSWVLSLYAIVSAATLIVGGVIGDRIGHKRVLVIGTAAFTVASLACGFAPNVAALLVARAFQALSSALMTPAGAALVLREFPPSRRGTAIAAWAAAGSVATAVGPTLGALLVDVGGWQWAFWICVPFGCIGLALVPRLVQEVPREEVDLPDLISVPLIVASVSGIILGVTQSGRWGWADSRTVISVAAGLAVGVYVIARSSRHSRPLLDLSLFRFRSFRIANFSSLVFGSTFFALFFAYPRFTQDVWDYDVRAAGLLFLPIPVAGILFNGSAGRFADLHGPRRVMIAGGLSQAIGGLVFVFAMGDSRNLFVWFLGFAFIGLGSALSWPAVFANTVIGVPPHRFGAATSINQTAQRMATAGGAAIQVSVIGEASGPTVGNYDRIFVLTVIGGMLGATIGLFMSGVAER
jgi:EmrB/QacA subfamily drug resistance transporter